MQILPEKYSYYRRFHQASNDATDCVICMTPIDLSQRSNDCMVSDYFLIILFSHLLRQIFWLVSLSRGSVRKFAWYCNSLVLDILRSQKISLNQCFIYSIFFPGYSVRSFLPHKLPAQMDGRKNGMPNMPSPPSTSVEDVYSVLTPSWAALW